MWFVLELGAFCSPVMPFDQKLLQMQEQTQGTFLDS